MADRIPLTVEGYDRLKKELDHLKHVERPAVIERIAIARSHGDLSENAEYHAAREQQSFIEGRIQDLESILARAEVIDPSKLSGDRIMFGATVTLYDTEKDEEVVYQLVGEPESNIKEGKISVMSPLGKALIGKYAGDEVEVKTRNGTKVYEIVDVEYK